jgi:hypothetical protein
VEKALHRVTDTKGAFNVTEVAKGKKISKSLLDPNDVFILDAGHEVKREKGEEEEGEKRANSSTGHCMGRIQGQCGREEACLADRPRLRDQARQGPQHSRVPCVAGRGE